MFFDWIFFQLFKELFYLSHFFTRKKGVSSEKKFILTHIFFRQNTQKQTNQLICETCFYASTSTPIAHTMSQSVLSCSGPSEKGPRVGGQLPPTAECFPNWKQILSILYYCWPLGNKTFSILYYCLPHPRRFLDIPPPLIFTLKMDLCFEILVYKIFLQCNGLICFR